jgi:hypothetical protein
MDGLNIGTALAALLFHHQNRTGWVGVCQKDGRFYFADGRTQGLTTCVSDDIILTNYDDVKNILNEENGDLQPSFIVEFQA